MLFLLPPSEGKTAPEVGPTFSAQNLCYPSLNETRTIVRKALIELCKAHPTRAAKVLGLGPQQLGLVTVNAHLAKAQCAPAIEIYTGVLYDALDFSSLPAAARKRAQSRVLISSALFGFVRPQDPIPAYRLSGDTSLPPLGNLAHIWRAPAQTVLTDTSGLLIDLRSGAYTNLAPIPAELASRSCIARVLLEKNGKRSVVSHHNKATKGRLIRAVLQTSGSARSLDDLVPFLAGIGFTAELVDEPKKAIPRLDIVVPEA